MSLVDRVEVLDKIGTELALLLCVAIMMQTNR